MEVPLLDVTSRTLSPRGLKLFYLIAFPLLALSAYQLFTESGLVIWLHDWLTANWGESRKTMKLAFALTLVPILAIASGPAYLHDYLCKQGLWAPKQKKTRPPNPLTDW
jgi:hypothetical protein